jgi:hypothetical protein
VKESLVFFAHFHTEVWLVEGQLDPPLFASWVVVEVVKRAWLWQAEVFGLQEPQAEVSLKC